MLFKYVITYNPKYDTVSFITGIETDPVINDETSYLELQVKFDSVIVK